GAGVLRAGRGGRRRVGRRHASGGVPGRAGVERGSVYWLRGVALPVARSAAPRNLRGSHLNATAYTTTPTEGEPMAAFCWPEDAGRLDVELLRETSVSLYFSREVLAEHVGWLREHGYLVHSFDCSTWAAEDDFHAEASRVLGFPDYYGHNLAAFKDCLCAV